MRQFILDLLGLWQPPTNAGYVGKLWLCQEDVTQRANLAIVSKTPGKWALGAVRLYPAADKFSLDTHWVVGFVKWDKKQNHKYGDPEWRPQSFYN